jgi:hypothetical protein
MARVLRTVTSPKTAVDEPNVILILQRTTPRIVTPASVLQPPEKPLVVVAPTPFAAELVAGPPAVPPGKKPRRPFFRGAGGRPVVSCCDFLALANLEAP